MKMLFFTLTLSAFTAGAGFAASASAGQEVYNRACKSCHGADGTANPAIAKMMKVEIKDLKSSDVQSKSDAQLKAIITNGQGKMRPVRSVTGSSVNDVIAYVRSLKK